ncbi:MAG: hypothetical protein ACTSYA_03690 [Candidatus Kariarchaeaceae archaeon]
MVNETPSFDAESLMESSIGNMQGTLVALVAYSKEKGFDTKAFAYFVGKKFAPGWISAKEWSIDEVARRIAINYASMGASEIRVTGEDDVREIHLKDWPNQILLDAFGVKRSDSTDIFYVNEPIMDFIDLKYTFEVNDDQVILRIEK